MTTIYTPNFYTPNEAEWQRTVTDAATRYGWKHCHTRKATVRKGQFATPTSLPGWPDLVLWHTTHKVVLFVELKTDTGSLSLEQVDVLGSLSDAGARTAVWRPRDRDHVMATLRDPHGDVAARIKVDSPNGIGCPCADTSVADAARFEIEGQDELAWGVRHERTIDAKGGARGDQES